MCIPEKRKKHPQVQNWKKMINVLIGNRANGIHHSDNIDCALQKKKDNKNRETNRSSMLLS